MPETDNCTRALIQNMEVREINEETRTATFVAATENGVKTWRGLEVLRMSGVDLKRYKKNPIVLDSHRYWSGIDAIVGNAKVSVEGRLLVAEITFAEIETGEKAWQLVKAKILKTLSVGFHSQKYLDIEDGETDGEGDGKVDGPARIVTKWELLEISVVALPADENALMRKFMEWRKGSMDGENGKVDKVEELVEQTTPPAAPTTEVRELIPGSMPIAAPELQRRAEIMDMTPPGLEATRDRCIAEGKTPEMSRALILAELANKTKPVGTPAPEDATTRGEVELKVKDVSDEDFKRSLCG